MDNSDQWKSTGSCSECRRKNYCKTKCKAYKTRTNNQVKAVVAETVFKFLKDIYEKPHNY